MQIKEDHSLKNHNTYKVDNKTKYFVEISEEKELVELLSDPKFSKAKIFILGKGANTLFSKDFDGLVLKISTKGIEVIDEDKTSVTVKVKAGEDWEKLVDYTVEQNWGGFENMVMIPGTVGAAAAGNIAAFGRNVEDFFVSLEAIDRKTLKTRTFNKKQCKFKYRTSGFRNSLKDKFVITSVTLKLLKNIDLETYYHSRYESLEEELKLVAEKPYSQKDIANAIKSLRSKKYPDITKPNVGSAGCVLKNPVISQTKLKELEALAPGVQYYPVDKLQYHLKRGEQESVEKYVKVAAGWLFEETGWKGKKIGHVGTYDQHSLIVVTDGKATGQEVLDFIGLMKADFKKNFKIDLEEEISII